MRRAFAGQVSVGGDPVGLDLADEVSVDVTDLARADGDPAVPGGELLEGLSFDDSPTFETWVSAERARLASDCRAVLYRLAVESLAAEDFAAAARIAALAVHLDPLKPTSMRSSSPRWRAPATRPAPASTWRAAPTPFVVSWGWTPRPRSPPPRS